MRYWCDTLENTIYSLMRDLIDAVSILFIALNNDGGTFSLSELLLVHENMLIGQMSKVFISLSESFSVMHSGSVLVYAVLLFIYLHCCPFSLLVGLGILNLYPVFTNAFFCWCVQNVDLIVTQTQLRQHYCIHVVTFWMNAGVYDSISSMIL